MDDAPAKKKGLSDNWAVREVDHLFARLGYYTRFVGYSKWFLGVVALVLLVSLIAWPLLTKDRSGIRVSFVDNGGKTPQQPAASPVMNSPEYRGVTDAGDQYKFNGVKATQMTPTLIRMEQIEGQLLRHDGRWYSLDADHGDYHQDTKILELTGNVTVLDDRGYSFTTTQATMNTATSDITGNAPVVARGRWVTCLPVGLKSWIVGSILSSIAGQSRCMCISIVIRGQNE